jgi:D-alanyl-D-alanine carboxypeptidase
MRNWCRIAAGFTLAVLNTVIVSGPQAAQIETSAEAAILEVYESGEVLWEKNADQAFHPQA